MSNRAFCIGNGRSSVGLDLRRLSTAGVTYGSNAITRDAWIHNVVCCDRAMLGEAINLQIEKKKWNSNLWDLLPYISKSSVPLLAPEQMKLKIKIELSRNDLAVLGYVAAKS